MVEVGDGGTPSPQYMEIIIRGAVQNELPMHYVDQLKQIKTNGNTEQIETYEKIMQMIKDD